MGCSKAKVNVVLNELIDNDYVQIYNNTKGRYVLTEDAKKDNEEIKVLKIGRKLIYNRDEGEKNYAIDT